MNGTDTCTELQSLVAPYAERALPEAQRTRMAGHLCTCEACRRRLERVQAVQGFLRGTLGPQVMNEGFLEETGRRLRAVKPVPFKPVAEREPESEEPASPALQFAERLGAAPWWIVSTALHALLITLIGLVTMAVTRPELDAALVTVTSLDRKLEAKAEPPKPEQRDVFASAHDTPATDSDSTVASNIVVPPDILAKAELGDHFETINPDRPDTQSAFGNPDARMFHSVSGNDEPEGGGGMGGSSLSDELIGVGGSGSAGSGGGWGGGNGTGVGIGNGSGKGSFGTRTGGGRKLMVMRHGGSKATESAVDLGLEWLARNQEADGHWDSKKHGNQYAACDTGMAGFALLAFLGAGHTERIGKYRDNVRRGVEWLIKKQADNGCLAYKDENIGYNHAIAGMALAEAAGMAREPYTKEAAQKALEYSVNIHQCGDGSEKRGWRYAAKQEGDLSNSGWFIMQLKSAKVAGLKVPHGGFEGAEWFLDHVEDKNFAKDANNAYDNGRHRYGYVTGPGEVTYTRTAIGCLCRQFMGTKPDELVGGVEWFVKTGGLPSKNVVHLYYWYYGTLCAFQQGGDIWQKWNEALKPTLLNSQCKGGPNDGSWDFAGTGYGEMWGRVGSTALSCMCLEVYYRYLPMYR